MFDTYINRTSPAYPQTVTKHEHRAPTDESVKLLREMEEKAKEQVLESYRFDADNDLANGYVVVSRSPQHLKLIITVIFNLNGKEYTINEDIREDKFKYEDKMEVWRYFLTKVSRAITEQFIPKITEQTINTGLLS